MSGSVEYHPRFEWQGTQYETVSMDDMSWEEMDLLEQITRLTQGEMRDARLQRFSRVSAGHALIAINRAQERKGEPLTSYEEFKRVKMSDLHVIPTPLPPDPAGDEEVDAPVPPETLPPAAGKPRRDAPVYERLGDDDPLVEGSAGTGPTSGTSEPNTSEPSPPASGSDPGSGTSSTSGTASP